MYLTEKFAAFVRALEYDDLPDVIALEAKRRMLDNLGAAVGGWDCWAYRDLLMDIGRQLGAGSYTAIGSPKAEYSLPVAAMIDAALAQANELDDGHKYAGVHVGCCVVPAVLLIGAELGSSGKDVLTAVVAGYEVVYRLAVGMSPHMINKGFHPSAGLDALGVMAAVGKLMGLNERQLANGLGMAALYGGGFMEATISGQQSKGVMTGRGALNGILAAWLAQNDFDGTLSVFEGGKGMFNAICGGLDVDALCEGLGTEFHIEDTYNKLYPTCRHAQTAVEAVIELQKKYGFDWRDVKAVRVGTYKVSKDITGQIYEPQDQGEAKFSMPYGIALGLITGGVSPSYMKEQYFTDRLYLDLAALVEVAVDPEIQSLYPSRRGSRVCVVLKDGRELKVDYFDLKGAPGNPVDWQGLADKFVNNVAPMLGQEKAMELAARLAKFDQEADIEGFYREFCRSIS